MPAIKIFQQLRDKVKKQGGLLPVEKRAMFWFRDYATALTVWQDKFSNRKLSTLTNKDDFTKQAVGKSKAEPGFIYFFHYDAKWKDTLPYWDAFPFTLVIHKYDDGFLGLNFHYLSYEDRARFFDALYPFREGRPSRPTVRDIRMRLKVTYAILKVTSKLVWYRPCIKRYLTDHIKSNLLKVGSKEWDIALFLPVAQFQTRTEQHVWKKSHQMVNRYKRKKLF